MPVRNGYVDFVDGQLHYRSAGPADGQPLILIHQSPSSSRMWEAVLPGLGDRGFRAIAVDMPGYGESSPPESEPDGLPYYSAAIREALSNLGLERYDILGHHTGASVAMQMAVDAPDRVRKLVLWGVPLLPPERLHRLANEAVPTYDSEGTEIVRYLKSRAAMSGPLTGVDVHIRCLIEMLQTGYHRPWGHRAVGRADHKALLQQIDQPTYCLAGDREGLLDATREAATILTNAEFYSFPNAGLDVADEFPNEFIDKVTAFLKK